MFPTNFLNSTESTERNSLSTNSLIDFLSVFPSTDLIKYFDKLAPMDNSLYVHTTEGKDDMPAHIKSALTNNQISLSVKNNELLLGTWQGLYLFEHRLEDQKRSIIHHFLGE